MGSGVQAQLIFPRSKRIPSRVVTRAWDRRGPKGGKGGDGGEGGAKSKSALGADKP